MEENVQLRVGVPDFSPIIENTDCLNNEEFDSLVNATQLLRISQLRYIVQKFSIPATGNKSKLLALVISIFHSIRYDKILVQVFKEVNAILSQQEPTFANPLLDVLPIEIAHFDPSFRTCQNPPSVFSPESMLTPPFLARAGQSQGSFTFVSPGQRAPVIIDFLSTTPLNGISAELFVNGIEFDAYGEDPIVRPIDVTNVVNPPLQSNTFEIKSIVCSSPVMVCLRVYNYIGTQEILDQICGKHIHIGSSKPQGKGKNCAHADGFDLTSFITKSLATGQWNCPICGCEISTDQVACFQMEDEMSIFPGVAENFHDDEIDWDFFKL